MTDGRRKNSQGSDCLLSTQQTVLFDSRKNQQWMLKTLGKCFLKEDICIVSKYLPTV